VAGLTFKLATQESLHFQLTIVFHLEIEVWRILQLALEHLPVLAYEVASDCTAYLPCVLVFYGTGVEVHQPPQLISALPKKVEPTGRI
jgi:hypothetical protein